MRWWRWFECTRDRRCVVSDRTWKSGDECFIQHPWDDSMVGPYRIMVIADGYAMIRRPHAFPSVASVKDLRGPQS